MRIALFFFSILCCSYSFAQHSFRKNTVYAEFLGSGVDWSVNYDRQLQNKPGLGVHLGLGYATATNDQFRFSIPLGVNYLFDIGHHKSFIETGLGVTWAEQAIWESKIQNLHQYRAALVPSAGYRHQAPYGLMWRINYNAFFTKYRIIPLFLGLSAGWTF